MATKVQAKAAIDAAVTTVKADIDNILPVGANIIDGNIDFNPTREAIQLDAGGAIATATSWRDTIQTNLTTAGRTFTTRQVLGRRGEDGVHQILIITQAVVYMISNF